MKSLLISFVCLFSYSAVAQSIEQFNKFSHQTGPGIKTNAVSNMHYENERIWFGSNRGLAWYDTHSFNSITTGHSLLDSRGVYSVSAQGNRIFFSIGESRTVENKNIPTAMGFGFSENNGVNWTFINVPLDNPDNKTIIFGNVTLDYLPIIVPEQSVTYDSEVDGDTLYIAAYASGIMYSPDKGVTWNRYIMAPDYKNYISPDSAYVFDYDPRDDNNLNLRGFSVHKTKSGVLVAGTAGGFNVRYQPQGWLKYVSQPNNNSSLPGNWVTGIKSHIVNGKERIWAICWRALQSFETEGLAYTDDYGKTWTRSLSGERIYDLTFSGDTVLAAGRNGIYYTRDNINWSFKTSFYDLESQNGISSSEYYSAAFEQKNRKWVIGSSSGLLTSSQSDIFSENNWTISRVNVSSDGHTKTFAYPNPFSPDDDGMVRVSFPEGHNAQLTVFSTDFLTVKTINSSYTTTNEIIWDGRDAFGNRISNGVYFYSVKCDGAEYWGKILVLE